MVTEVSVGEFGQNVGEMLDKVESRRDSVVITKNGEAVAVLVDPALFERMQRSQSRFEELSARIAAGFADIPEEEGMAEIDRVCYEVRHGARG